TATRVVRIRRRRRGRASGRDEAGSGVGGITGSAFRAAVGTAAIGGHALYRGPGGEPGYRERRIRVLRASANLGGRDVTTVARTIGEPRSEASQRVPEERCTR